MTAVLAQRVERRFGTTQPPALGGVDLEVGDGEVYGFLGPNGAGKSTLVRILCTLLLPSAGRAEVAGYDVVERPDDVRLRIGVALQSASLDLKQTGRELLRLQGRLYGLRPREVDARLRELGELVAIGDALDRRIGTYSGGMRRRLDLAAALVHHPEVLFLDEPTTGLDPQSRTAVWEEVRRLNREQGMTIFLTTQYLEEADELADRVGIIAGGLLVAEGAPEELKRSLGADLVVVAVDGDAAGAADVLSRAGVAQRVQVDGTEVTIEVADGPGAVSPVAVALAGGGVKVRALSVRQPTLDDVFLSLTGGHLREEP